MKRADLIRAFTMSNSSMPSGTRSVPKTIDGYRVVESSSFAEAILPEGYRPPDDGSPPLELVKNVAICTADGVEGFYTFFCTEDWRYVTYAFEEDIEGAKLTVLREFGRDVGDWVKTP